MATFLSVENEKAAAAPAVHLAALAGLHRDMPQQVREY